MGEARRRGTDEQRAIEAKARRLKEAADKLAEEARREAELTPEQRQQRAKARTTMASILGLAGAWR